MAGRRLPYDNTTTQCWYRALVGGFETHSILYDPEELFAEWDS